MTNILILLALSALMVEALNRHPFSRRALKKICKNYSGGACRSFLLDMPLLLPLVGMLVEAVARRVHGSRTARRLLYVLAISIFIAISGSLYLDYLNFNFLAPFLGHREAWGGNHFMWNSGIELVGLQPFTPAMPTYKHFLGAWNVFALLLFAVYPLVMVKAGTRLYGLLFGYTEKQTGVSALFFERNSR